MQSGKGRNMIVLWVVVNILLVHSTEKAFTKGSQTRNRFPCNSNGAATICGQHFRNESIPAQMAGLPNCSVLMNRVQCLESRMSLCKLNDADYHPVLSRQASAARRRMESVCHTFRTLSGAPKGKRSLAMDSNKSCQHSEVDDCLQSVYPFMKNESLPGGLTVDKEERKLACSAFSKGMMCVDDYTTRCLEPKQRKTLQRSLSAARRVMTVVCSNESMSEAYGQHNECFKELSSKISDCLDVLQKYRMKRAYYSKEEAIKETCCGQKSFLHCVAHKAHSVCDQNAIDFATRIFKKMYTPHINNRCRSITLEECSGCNRLGCHLDLILVLVILCLCTCSSLWNGE